MKHSKIVSVLLWLAALAAFVGFLDASYLSANHLAGKTPPCTIHGACEKVLNSPYAFIAGVPLAILGMFFYAAAFMAAIACIDNRSRTASQAMLFLSALGTVVSVALVYVQLGPLQSVCLYCMASAACSLAYGAFTLWSVILAEPATQTKS